MSVISHLIYRSNTIPIKTTANYFVDINKLFQMINWKGDRPGIYKTTLTKNKVGLTVPDIDSYCKVTVIKTA